MCEVFLFIGILTEKLEQIVSDEDVAKIANDLLITWESLSPRLGLYRREEVIICRSCPTDYGKQKYLCLQMWKEAKGDEATYGALIQAAELAGNRKLADDVRSMADIPKDHKHSE